MEDRFRHVTKVDWWLPVALVQSLARGCHCCFAEGRLLLELLMALTLFFLSLGYVDSRLTANSALKVQLALYAGRSVNGHMLQWLYIACGSFHQCALSCLQPT